jgi:hypothetical protein
VVTSANRPVLYEYFRTAAETLRAKFAQTGTFGASANAGAAREVLVSNFLREVVPPHLTVESGEIWDSEGNKSGQLDIVLARNDVPRLPLGAGSRASAFIAEGVYAVVEVKSNLTADAMAEDLAKLKRVADLKIRASTVFYVGESIDRPIRVAFGFGGAKFDTLMPLLGGQDFRAAADAVCILDRGTVIQTDIAKKLGFQYSGPDPAPYYMGFEGRVLGLAMFYYFLTQKAASFVGRAVHLGQYFTPLNGWAD